MVNNCTICGSDKFIKAGTRRDRSGLWQMIWCQVCGHKQKSNLLQPNGVE